MSAAATLRAAARQCPRCGVAVALGIAGALLAGCAGLLHSNAPPEQTYYLRPPAAANAATGSGSAAGDAAVAASAAGAGSGPGGVALSVRVGHPGAGPGLDSPRIQLVEADHRMNFYAGSRWPVPVPDLIEALAVDTLRASGEWASVQDSATSFGSDYLLQIGVRRFEADYTADAALPTVYVVLDCALGRQPGPEVVASFVAAGSAAAASNRMSAVVAAFEQASGEALAALARRAAEVARADAQHAAQSADGSGPSSR